MVSCAAGEVMNSMNFAMFPVLLLLSGWDRWRRARGLAVGYMLLIWFAAVYLNHHYVIDVILGVYYGSVVWCAKTVWKPLKTAHLRRCPSRETLNVHFSTRRASFGGRLATGPFLTSWKRLLHQPDHG